LEKRFTKRKRIADARGQPEIQKAAIEDLGKRATFRGENKHRGGGSPSGVPAAASPGNRDPTWSAPQKRQRENPVPETGQRKKKGGAVPEFKKVQKKMDKERGLNMGGGGGKSYLKRKGNNGP